MATADQQLAGNYIIGRMAIYRMHHHEVVAEREEALAALRRELGLEVTREQLIAELFGELVGGGVCAEGPADGAVRVEQVGRRPGLGCS